MTKKQRLKIYKKALNKFKNPVRYAEARAGFCYYFQEAEDFNFYYDEAEFEAVLPELFSQRPQKLSSNDDYWWGTYDDTHNLDTNRITALEAAIKLCENE